MSTEGQIVVDGEPVTDAAPGSSLSWLDRAHGEAILTDPSGARVAVLVEGGPADWVVVLRGRRIGVSVRGHRDQLLADTSRLRGARHRPAEVRATLPGLVLRVLVQPGDVIAEGDPLLTLQAMKMENEIRATHRGRVVAVEVAPGEAIATGAVLVRLADPEP